MKKFSESRFLDTPVIGILRGYSKDQVLKIAQTYVEAGYSNLEITMNTPNSLEIIKSVAAEFEGKLNIGAGTVLSKKQVDQVLDSEGQFIVSPIVDMNVITYCVRKEVPIFPGAYSPTEIYRAAEAGARMVKVFPATNLGPDYIKDVLAPLNHLELMPTGGVNLENLEVFVKAGAKAFGMGGNLFRNELIQKEDWDGLKNHLLKFKATLMKSFKG
ncbi:MAG: bifunctional 4-hydroxy-2-oxoglutarate aldolase/2-dehydro-3-deoxy-phosphogluconate aldolase [Bacteroidota bacterium]